ncbi:MAG: SUMF1/EgtB/PvdO family nonheme iron enzyme [Opitutae bacterium]|nr:SUMF1/EgtB/PvdO family nonheme iron enzyme [Opitutae bacterium]
MNDSGESDSSSISNEFNPDIMFREGEYFGQFKIIRLLGMGGMGQVFEARHRVVGTRHALKLISPQLLEHEGALEFFRKEARVMAQLDHPGIVRVDDYGETDGHHWLRQELIEGVEVSTPDGEGSRLVTLGDYIDHSGGVLPECEVYECLSQFLDAIGFAHSKGCIHRDLKPGNILIDPKGMKIADFGLVHLMKDSCHMSFFETLMQAKPDSSNRTTSENVIVGTFEYMSPEQKEGYSDERSDLFSIGLICFRILTGQKSPGFKKPSKLVEGIHPGWDDWIEKALAEDANNRFQTAHEMMEALPSIAYNEDEISQHVSGYKGQGHKAIHDDHVVNKSKKGLVLIGVFAVFATIIISIFINMYRDDSATKPYYFNILRVEVMGANNGSVSLLNDVAIRIYTLDNRDSIIKAFADAKTDKLNKESLDVNNWDLFKVGYIDYIFELIFKINIYSSGVARNGIVEIKKPEDGLCFVVASNLNDKNSQYWIEEIESGQSRIQLADIKTISNGVNPFVDFNEIQLEWKALIDENYPCIDENEKVTEYNKRMLKMESDYPGRKPCESDESFASRKDIQKLKPGILKGETFKVYDDRISVWGVAFPGRLPDETDEIYATRVQVQYRDIKPGETYQEWHDRLKNKFPWVESGKLVDLPLGWDLIKWSNSLLENFPDFSRGGEPETLEEYRDRMITVNSKWGLKTGEYHPEFVSRNNEAIEKIKAKENYKLVIQDEIEMIYCPPGDYFMGSESAEEGRNIDEIKHKVNISQGFWLSKYEITQSQLKSIIEQSSNLVDIKSISEKDYINTKQWIDKSSVYKGDKLPVDNIPWSVASYICLLINYMESNGKRINGEYSTYTYRLPTEAQWEFACRAGTTNGTAFGDHISDANANYGKDSNTGKTQEIGSFLPNKWGFHDMHGNVAEWCLDSYKAYPSPRDEDYPVYKDYYDPLELGNINAPHVSRGGSWRNSVYEIRSAYREEKSDNIQKDGVQGFRIAFSDPFIKPSIPAQPDKYPWLVLDLSRGFSTDKYKYTFYDNPPSDFNVLLKKPGTNKTFKSSKMLFKYIPSGEFMMGSDLEYEKPIHKVNLTKGFYMGIYEVTLSQWMQIQNWSPISKKKSSAEPVQFLKWEKVAGPNSFLTRLRARTDLPFDLPSEAQWELAARSSGSEEKWHFGDSIKELNDYAWHRDNSSGRLEEVGLKSPNTFGIYDLYGNAREWVRDWYVIYPEEPQTDPVITSQPSAKNSSRVLRGGGFRDSPENCRSAARFTPPLSGDLKEFDDIGFRIVLNIESN